MRMEYEDFTRSRITELRIKKNVSEHRMSLDLGKSGSYIRGITSGVALPSLKELFNIIQYFEMTPAEFFAPLEDKGTLYYQLCQSLRELDDTTLEKVALFISWLKPE